MSDDRYTSLRRRVLSLGLTGAIAGIAGCSGMVEVETEDESEPEPDDTSGPSADIDAASFTFNYNSGAQQVEIVFNGGAGITASNLQVQHTSGKEVIWAELGSTAAGPDEEISSGATAVLGPDVLNWEVPITEDETVRLIYVGKETPATLERYSPPETTDSESTVPASISSFSIESQSDQEIKVSFNSSKQLERITVSVFGPEDTTLIESDFTETQTGDGNYTYETSYSINNSGEFEATLDDAVDVNGNGSLNGQSIRDSTAISSEDTTPPSISAFSIANPSDQQLRTSFDSDERLSTVQVHVNGSESATLTKNEFTVTESGNGTYTYEAIYDIGSGGNVTATLERATDNSSNNGADGQSVQIRINEDTLPVTQEFTEETSTWDTFGDATFAEVDGNETLRLTGAETEQKGGGIYTEPFRTAQGIVAEIRYYADQGTGADGFTFLLLNESQVELAEFSLGSSGGSLGYSGNPGITGGYLGVGFDEHGNFANGSSDSHSDGVGRTPQSVTVRGAGNEANGSSSESNSYPHLVTNSPSGTLDGGWRWARVTIDPLLANESLGLRVEMSFDRKESWETIIDDEFDATSIGSDLPEELLFGFSGGTGSGTNIHAIDSVAASRPP